MKIAWGKRKAGERTVRSQTLPGSLRFDWNNKPSTVLDAKGDTIYGMRPPLKKFPGPVGRPQNLLFFNILFSLYRNYVENAGEKKKSRKSGKNVSIRHF